MSNRRVLSDKRGKRKQELSNKRSLSDKTREKESWNCPIEGLYRTKRGKRK
jgi:hypothetical protein